MKRLVLACVLASFVSVPYASAGVVVDYKSGNAQKATAVNSNVGVAGKPRFADPPGPDKIKVRGR